MCIRDRLGVFGQASSREPFTIVAGRSATYDDDDGSRDNVGLREGHMLKIPMGHSLPSFSGDQFDDGEWLYEGMMCMYVPEGHTPSSGSSHIAIYWQGDWRRINFGNPI